VTRPGPGEEGGDGDETEPRGGTPDDAIRPQVVVPGQGGAPDEHEDLTDEPQLGAVEPPLDLTAEPVRSTVEPSIVPTDLESVRERKRGYLAAALVGILAALVLGSPIALAFGANVDELKSLLEVLLPPVIALTGTAVGFYFGGPRG
jgi:hypothetical protein